MSTRQPRARCAPASPTPASSASRPSGIYVAEPLSDAFIRAFVARTRAIRLGDALDYDHDMGSLINDDQLDRVQRARRGREAQGRHGAAPEAGVGPIWASCSTSRPS